MIHATLNFILEIVMCIAPPEINIIIVFIKYLINEKEELMNKTRNAGRDLYMGASFHIVKNLNSI